MRMVPNHPVKSICVTGMFIGAYLDNNQPVLFNLEGALFLPIFTTPERYEASIKAANVKGAKIQQITDHKEFIDSVKGHVRLMLDPWTTERGTTRFTELTDSLLAN